MKQGTTLPYPGHRPLPQLPDLDVIRPVGSGSYGEVWLARNRTTGKLLAVKLIRREATDASGRAARETASLIRYEANTRGQHEALLAIHHVGQTAEFLYYTMDAADDVSGQPASPGADYRPATLASRLEVGALSPAESLLFARQLLAGLACLHRNGLVHRDVKPSNCVFVDGKLKLADFGLVTEADGTVSRLGTPRYMPPDGRMDARADAYASGLVIYEMYTGLPADSFPRWSTSAVAARKDPTVLVLNRLVLRACERDPDDRFQDAQEMLTALAQLQARARSLPRRNRVPLILAAACVASALVIGAVALWPSRAQHVHVNFITAPFEAEIYLDGRRAVDPHGKPYTTPCTVLNLPARAHQVVFKKNGLPDLVVGTVAFSREREVEANWETEGDR
ncbi:serine/threonine-protein kinase [Planctomycetota bacterium]